MPICKRQIGIPATIALVSLMVLSVLATLWGCGKKGPPEPPTGSSPPYVGDLAYGISANTAQLTWSVPPVNPDARLPVTGFLIYRSQLPLLEQACPNCPNLFKIIGDVPVRDSGPGKDEKPVITFTDTIEAGYRYTYKVYGYSKDGIRSKTSNVVEFNF